MREKKTRGGKENPDNEKPTFKEKLCRRLDIQPDVFLGESMIEIRGKNSVCVRGGCYILVYRPDEIVLALRDYNIAIRGRRLICTSYNAGAVIVDGLVGSISFEEVSNS